MTRFALASLGALATLSLALLASPLPADAVTWTVRPDSTGDFPTIQAAVEGAAGGDVVELDGALFERAGNYDVDLLGKAITIRSVSGDPTSCIVDCTLQWDEFYPTTSQGFRMVSGEGSGTVIEGITIRSAGVIEGYGGWGPALWVGGTASPTIRNVIVRENIGPGIACSGSALITGCVITENSTSGTYSGAAGLSLSGGATIDHCTITRNRSSGYAAGIGGHGFSGEIRDCLIAENTAGGEGGGLYLTGGVGPTIVRTTIASNRADHGAALYVNTAVSLASSIVWSNCPGIPGSDINLGPAGALFVECSDYDPDLVDGPGLVIPTGNNFDVDPLFCQTTPCRLQPGPPTLYTLATNSPLLGVAGCDVIGGLGEGCTIGVEPMTWGKLKSLYR